MSKLQNIYLTLILTHDPNRVDKFNQRLFNICTEPAIPMDTTSEYSTTIAASQLIRMQYLKYNISGALSRMHYLGCIILDAIFWVQYLRCNILDAISRINNGRWYFEVFEKKVSDILTPGKQLIYNAVGILQSFKALGKLADGKHWSSIGY